MSGRPSSLFLSRVLLPYAAGFSISAYLLPENQYNRIAFQVYHLQNCYMNGMPLELARFDEAPGSKLDAPK